MLFGYFLAFLAAALWGLCYALDEKVLQGMPVVRLFFLHSVTGAVIGAIAWLAQGRSFGDLFTLGSGNVSAKLVIVTLLVAASAGFAILGSIQLLNASRASILEISYPLFVAGFTYFLFGQSLNPGIIVGGILIFIGSAIIVIWS